MFSLQNKKAIITGGGSGIGKAIALLFAKQGATVHIIELNQEAAKDVETEIRNSGGAAFSYTCDITNQQQVIEVINSISQVNILVNNAGIAHVGNAENTSEEDFEKVFAVNVKGAYNCIHATLPNMKKNDGGVILNMCSVAAFTGITDRFAYSMSKGAIHAITLSVAKDFLASNIRCNCISPARVHTPFVDGFLEKNYPDNKAEMFEKLSKSQPIGRMGTPNEVASLALYLCSNEAAFITGNNYNIDGGFITLNN
jgi:2-keto-3-deoxy-L-fuconate dehydrogenase